MQCHWDHPDKVRSVLGRMTCTTKRPTHKIRFEKTYELIRMKFNSGQTQKKPRLDLTHVSQLRQQTLSMLAQFSELLSLSRLCVENGMLLEP